MLWTLAVVYHRTFTWDAGVLPFRRVGAHRRLRLSDVLDLKQREAPVRAALDELQADTDELTAHGL